MISAQATGERLAQEAEQPLAALRVRALRIPGDDQPLELEGFDEGQSIHGTMWLGEPTMGGRGVADPPAG